MKILAFESSCDETAVAVVRDGRQVLSTAFSNRCILQFHQSIICFEAGNFFWKYCLS